MDQPDDSLWLQFLEWLRGVKELFQAMERDYVDEEGNIDA
jgi:hypothetical protein